MNDAPTIDPSDYEATRKAWRAYVKAQNFQPPELTWAKQASFHLGQLAQPNHSAREVHEEGLKEALANFATWRARRLAGGE